MDPSIWVETPFDSAFYGFLRFGFWSYWSHALRFTFLSPSTEGWNQDGHAFRLGLEVSIVFPFS